MLGICYLIWVWSPILSQFGGDNAHYLMMAKYYSPYSTASPVVEFFAKHNSYPPFYPVVLAVFGGGESVLVAHIVTTIFLLLAFVLFVIWLLLEDVPYWFALALMVIFALLPGTYMQALAVLSENLYLLLTLLVFVFVALANRRNDDLWLYYGGIGAGLAFLTRSAGITLVAAFVVYVFVTKHQKKWRLAVIAVLPIILRQLFRDNGGGSYISLAKEMYASAPIQALLHQLTIESHALWHGWISNINHGFGSVLVLGSIATVCCIGAIYRLYLRKIDAIYLFTYLVLILVWPFPAEVTRFIYVVVPIALYHGWYVLSVISDNLPSLKLKRLIPVLYCVIIAATSLPDLLFTVQRFNVELAPDLADFRRHLDWYGMDKQASLRSIVVDHAIYDDAKNISKYLSVKECVMSIKPSVIGFLSNRISLTPPDSSTKDELFLDAVLNQGCQYFYMMPIISPSYKQAFYPLERMRKNLKILHVGKVSKDNAAAIYSMLGKYNADSQKPVAK